MFRLSSRGSVPEVFSVKQRRRALLMAHASRQRMGVFMVGNASLGVAHNHGSCLLATGATNKGLSTEGALEGRVLPGTVLR